MSETTEIAWTDHTWSPWEGCQKVGPGCDNCYAEARNQRFARGANWGPGAPRRRTKDWTKPLAWNAKAAAAGVRRRVFPSLCDPFDNAVPQLWRTALLGLIHDTPNLDWLLLTKRIGNAAEMLRDDTPEGIRADELPNLWIGATVVNQEEADRDIPKLLAVPARVRFLSMEPLLGPVDLGLQRGWCRHCNTLTPGAIDGHSMDPASPCFEAETTLAAMLGWVITGGESGPRARPSHPDWFRSLRDQCAAAGVAYLHKQHGEWAPGSGDFGAGRYRTAAVAMDGRVVAGGFDAGGYPCGATSADGWSMVHWAGKKTAGRLLDGREHNEFPRPA